MADNRTRKQDRKQIKRLQKAIRKLEKEVEVAPSSSRTVEAMYRLNELRTKMGRVNQAMDHSSEWDDRDEDHESRVARDLSRKSERRDPWDPYAQEEYGLGYMQGRGDA